jgi:UDP-3-O-[3-hydroxymyristoyl] N-acetylglucosamine deacetylase/3-hydroxyacyl-[acyl-carrier-protein] dehydratase
MAVLPHRPPFCWLIVLSKCQNLMVGMKNVTMNENFFLGHFPEAPVMPGVFCWGYGANRSILVLSTVPDPENYLTLPWKLIMLSSEQVLPGDTLYLNVIYFTPIRRGICHMQANAYANGKLVAEAELMAQIAKETVLRLE